MRHSDSFRPGSSGATRRGRARAAAFLGLAMFFGGHLLYGGTVAPAAYWGKQVTRAPFPTNKVAVTFDDGVSANTLGLVRTLNRYDAHATFFFVGRRANENAAIQRLVLRQGSEIGNHTWDHVSLSGLSMASALDQVSLTDGVIYRATGRWPRWVRSRSGKIDGTGMQAVMHFGHLYCNWDVEGFDTDPRYSTAQITNAVLSNAKGGSIILLHETNPRTIAAVPAIIEGLRRKGLVVTTVTDLLSR
jgi:peptidoglycan/xylan/chitin deacetylase (PgdA/CDA1 family)